MKAAPLLPALLLLVSPALGTETAGQRRRSRDGKPSGWEPIGGHAFGPAHHAPALVRKADEEISDQGRDIKTTDTLNGGNPNPMSLYDPWTG